MSKENVSDSADYAALPQGSQQQDPGKTVPLTQAGSYQAEYIPHEKSRIPGVYAVQFHPGHTMSKHFAFLGREFKVNDLDEGYYAYLDEKLFNAVRCDPGVEFIEDNTSGKYC